MKNDNLIGTAIVYNDAYDGISKYAKLIKVFGDVGIWRSITKEEAGLNPRKVRTDTDARIDQITGGTGIID